MQIRPFLAGRAFELEMIPDSRLSAPATAPVFMRQKAMHRDDDKTRWSEEIAQAELVLLGDLARLRELWAGLVRTQDALARSSAAYAASRELLEQIDKEKL